jgi:hypothetical protein
VWLRLRNRSDYGQVGQVLIEGATTEEGPHVFLFDQGVVKLLRGIRRHGLPVPQEGRVDRRGEAPDVLRRLGRGVLRGACGQATREGQG